MRRVKVTADINDVGATTGIDHQLLNITKLGDDVVVGGCCALAIARSAGDDDFCVVGRRMRVVAGSTKRYPIRACIDIERLRTIAAVDDEGVAGCGPVAAPVDCVSSVVAIVGGAPDDSIIAAAGIDHVVAAAADNDVLAGAAVDRVPGSTVEQDLAVTRCGVERSTGVLRDCDGRRQGARGVVERAARSIAVTE